MFHSSKPYTAVTAQIEVLTGEQYSIEDSSGIVDLAEAIDIQSSGPAEASRALRKKLKYGNLHRQLRALTIIDFLIQNAGNQFLREFTDEMLLERLRIAATDSVSDPMLREKCKQLFGQWAESFKDKRGMERIAGLYRQLPIRKLPASQAKAKVLRESDERAPPMGYSVSVSSGGGPATRLSQPQGKRSSRSSKKEKKLRERSFNLEKEKTEILETLASSSVASTDLLNALKLVNREEHRVSEDAECAHRFDTCKQLRHKILRYIQQVDSEEYLGGLIHANEELVAALMAFEVLDKSVDDDSDSDQDILTNRGFGRSHDINDIDQSFSGLEVNPPRPLRPQRPASMATRSPFAKSSAAADADNSGTEPDDDDEDNPFGDRNAIGPTEYIRHVANTG